MDRFGFGPGKSRRVRQGHKAAALLHDMLTNPPATWSDERKHEYFDWAKAVVEQVRGANPKLAERFDAVWEVGGVVCGIRGDSMA